MCRVFHVDTAAPCIALHRRDVLPSAGDPIFVVAGAFWPRIVRHRADAIFNHAIESRRAPMLVLSGIMTAKCSCFRADRRPGDGRAARAFGHFVSDCGPIPSACPRDGMWSARKGRGAPGAAIRPDPSRLIRPQWCERTLPFDRFLQPFLLDVAGPAETWGRRANLERHRAGELRLPGSGRVCPRPLAQRRSRLNCVSGLQCPVSGPRASDWQRAAGCPRQTGRA